MKGDFSRVRFAPHDNFNGILPQQGKVLLDSDGIAQTLIENDWRETAAQDWVGQVAGVPAAIPDSFKVSAASLAGGVVTLTLGTGHIWADGLLARLHDSAGATVTRTATWLEPPLVATAGGAASVADGVMDAVVLEVWQHAINGFQIPDVLIEPALGGPDTAERLKTSFAFRLARLNAGQSCADLAYDESGRGALTASLVPPVTTSGDCPVEGSGGYSGFEHQLYRVEIADTNGAASQFKWSRVNAGLVGRGAFDPATQRIAITANLPAITGANRTSFYLEIESYDGALGYSRVVTGAQSTLSGSTLQCTAMPHFGAYPAAAGAVFFRLWDGISPVSAFPVSATPVQLENGILLQFDPDGAGKYLPGDYWMFPVRAQGIPNSQTLINARKPQGIVYHRVPLAEITWAGSGGGSFTAGTIEECRTIVPPLSRVKGCCTCRVGDGVASFGDFTSIQTAIDSLPAEGGEVCILPGRYYENVRIFNRRDIVIHGCGWQTRVASLSLGPQPPPAAAPANTIGAVFTIAASQHIELRSFAVEAADDEAGILIDGEGTSLSTNTTNVLFAAAVNIVRAVIDVTVEDMVITAATYPAVLAQRVELLRIDRNRVAMKNVRSLWPAIYASGADIHIDGNSVGIQSAVTDREWLPLTVTDDLGAAGAATQAVGVAASSKIAAHPGGIQIGGPSTDVYILENEIEGGSRNGITLGSFEMLDANGKNTLQWIGVAVTFETDDCCTGTLQPPGGGKGGGGGTLVAGGILTDIHIHRNRIRKMGLCGIGPVGFFDLIETLEIITIVGLNISANSIASTVLRDVEPDTGGTNAVMGYGAICVPDVRNLIVRDNTITDFGASPGLDVCGVFVLHGEMLQISRNTILETRDWTAAGTETDTGGARGGIVIVLGTPPTFGQPLDATLWSNADLKAAGAVNVAATPVYEPGLPAVRIEHNVVRVPLGYALALLGVGPFEIANNHFGCGGLIRTEARPLAQTVLILNAGTAIENAQAAYLPSTVYKNSQAAYSGLATGGFQNVSSGAVLFTGNMCQLEARASHQRELSSVTIFTPDQLIFSNNQCWLDAPRITAAVDALLLAGSLNVIGNRFQEAPNSVYFSGLTVGVANITGQNISTCCLIALGTLLSNNNNIALVAGVGSSLCAGLAKEFGAELGQ